MIAHVRAQAERVEVTRASDEGDGAEVLSQRIVVIRDGEFVASEHLAQAGETGRVREAGGGRAGAVAGCDPVR
jgi:hypothetical protein